MNGRVMNFRKRFIGTALALAVMGVSLAGCVVYPGGYGYGYAPAYYAAPPVSLGFGYYGGGGEGRRWR